MYSAKICGKQMDTEFGLYLPTYSVPDPQVKSNYKEIPYRDGSIDKTAPDGVVYFEDREWDLEFQKTGLNVSANDLPALSRSVRNAIHGRKGEIIFDDDLNYKWIGRVFVGKVECQNNGLLIVNIKLITEPYKYGIQDIVVTDTVETEVNHYTGDIATFNFDDSKTLLGVDVSMTPIQDLHGYFHPWPAGGGKNLFDANSVLTGYISNDSGALLPYDNSVASDYIAVEGGQNYRISPVLTAGNWGAWYDENKVFISGITGYSTAKTAPSNAKYLRFTVSRSGNNPNYATTTQVETGSEPTSWTPYSNICPISGRTGLSVYVSPTQDPDDATVYNVDWSPQAGTVYHGTVDPVAGQLTVDWASIEYDGSSDEPWTVYSVPRFSINRADFTSPGNSVVADIKTNRLQVIAKSSMGSTNYRFSASDSGSHQFMIRVDSSVNTVALLRTWLSNNPLQVVYKLTTPLTYQLTPMQVAALVGENNIWSDSGDVDVSISVMDMVTLANGRKPIVPTVNISSDSNITLMFYIKGQKKVVTIGNGQWKISDLVLFEGNTNVYEGGNGTITYTYPEASL